MNQPGLLTSHIGLRGNGGRLDGDLGGRRTLDERCFLVSTGLSPISWT